MANWFPVGKEGAKTTYTNKAACEAAEGQACYDITGKDLRWHDISGNDLVENPGKKASAENLDKKAAEQDQKYNLSSKDILRRIAHMYDECMSHISRTSKHLPLTCVDVTTVGGSATEEFLDPLVKENMHCVTSMCVLGATPVSILSAKCELGKVVIVFSADPGSDHILTYHVCR